MLPTKFQSLSIFLSLHGIQYYPCLFYCQSMREFSITLVYFSVSPSGHSILPLLGHLIKGNVSFYHHLASVVR
jgi:hypothetical protein